LAALLALQFSSFHHQPPVPKDLPLIKNVLPGIQLMIITAGNVNWQHPVSRDSIECGLVLGALWKKFNLMAQFTLRSKLGDFYSLFLLSDYKHHNLCCIRCKDVGSDNCCST